MKRIVLLVISVVLLLSQACKKTTFNPVFLQSISLGKDTVIVVVGSQATLPVILNPTNAIDTALTFSSSDQTIITVKKPGIITAVKTGVAIITAKNSTSTVSAQCLVKVVPPQASTLQVIPSALTLLTGTSKKITWIILPVTANTKVTWSSDNTNVDGTITAVSPGLANIKATTVDGSKLTSVCQVSVQNIDYFVKAIPNYSFISLGSQQAELVTFQLTNNSLYTVGITEYDLLNSKGFTIYSVTTIPGTVFTVLPGGAFTSLNLTAVVSLYEPGMTVLQIWRVVIYFDCNGNHYKMTIQGNTQVTVQV